MGLNVRRVCTVIKIILIIEVSIVEKMFLCDFQIDFAS